MKFSILVATALLIGTTCFAQGFKIATGEPLHSNQQELHVKGRNGILIKQKLSFGDYHTTRIKRSAITKWTGTTGIPGNIWTEHIEGRQSIRFSLADDTRNSEVTALTHVATNDLLVGTARGTRRLPGSLVALYKQTDISQNNFSVSIITDTAKEAWELFLDNTEAQVRRKQAAGYIARGDDYYTIEPVWQVEKKNGQRADIPFGSTGFEIKDKNNNVLAAVSLMDNGKVYLGPGTDEEKFLFANACAALLLQSVID